MKTEALRPVSWSGGQRLALGMGSLLVCLLPAFVHQQFITGPLVNAALLVCAVAVGGPEAAFLAVVPSAVAVTSGTLPLMLLPMVPLIVVSNVVLVSVFAGFYRSDPWAAMLLAALLKFGLLGLASIFLVPWIAPLAGTAAAMLSWPQLATALAGGVIALGILGRKQS